MITPCTAAERPFSRRQGGLESVRTLAVRVASPTHRKRAKPAFFFAK